MRQFRFTAGQREQIIAAYTAGASMADLAKGYGVRRQSISHLLRRSGVPVRERSVMTSDEVDQAVLLYAQGLSLEQIGLRLGWFNTTIYRQLKRRGVRMRDSHGRP